MFQNGQQDQRWQGRPVVELDTELVVVESFTLVLETLIFLGFLKNS